MRLVREPSTLHIRNIPDGFPRNSKDVVGLLLTTLHDLKNVENPAEGKPLPVDADSLRARMRELTNTVGHCMHVIRDIIYPADAPEGAIGGGGGGGGGGGAPAGGAAAIDDLADALMAHNVVPELLRQLIQLEFETRKVVSQVFKFLVSSNTRRFAEEYLPKHESVLSTLINCYLHTDAALPSGLMLRECIKWRGLHRALMVDEGGGLSPALHALLDVHVKSRSFEVAADAFETLTQLLTTNKDLVFQTLNPAGAMDCVARYQDFFKLFNQLFYYKYDNYVLKRQSLKLLSEFLLERENFDIMMEYITDVENMKQIMNCLRLPQPNVQYEAFHVFKVFVANPSKPPSVQLLLSRNKGKLCDFIRGFQNDKDEGACKK
jgi:calcium binding protein 39